MRAMFATASSDEDYFDVMEEVHYDPDASRVWRRLMEAHARRGLAYDAEALAAAALKLTSAPVDTLARVWRTCIFTRNGRKCRSGSGRCWAGCDIPF